MTKDLRAGSDFKGPWLQGSGTQGVWVFWSNETSTDLLAFSVGSGTLRAAASLLCFDFSMEATVRDGQL